MRKSGFFVFFLLPAVTLLLLFFILSNLNRAFIRGETERLVREQLKGSSDILISGLRHALEDGTPAPGILSRFAGDSGIYYMALLDARGEIFDWTSRYEGFLPLSQRERDGKDEWVIDSPEGRIFNIYSAFATENGQGYALYLGYSLKGLEAMLAHSRMNFWLLFAALAAAGMALSRGVYVLHKNAMARAEEAVAEKKEKERYKAISGFTAGVAHEIKNPLNGLALLLELLRAKAPGELSSNIDLGKGEVEKISQVIDRFSEVIKPVSLRKESSILSVLMDDVRSSVLREAETAGVRIVASAESIKLSADRLLLIQALTNIVRNSLEAGGGSQVRLSAVKQKKIIRIRIEDDGPGIPEDNLEQIFEPFFTTKAKGTGVGLFIAQKIIQAHGGTVRASNRAAGGAEFIVDIPEDRS